MMKLRKVNGEAVGIMRELYPGEASAKRYQEFQSKKILGMFLIIVIGIVATVCLHFGSREKSRLVEGTRLVRNEWVEGSYVVTLRGITQSMEGEMLYEVRERILGRRERQELVEQMMEKLPEIILGENESLMAVRKNLNLATRIEGYPFSIVWKSSNYDRVRTDGRVNTADLSPEGEMVMLTAVCAYEEEKWEKEIEIKLVPVQLSPREQYLAAMEEELRENDLLYRESAAVMLPEKIGEETVTWEEKSEENSFWPLPASILGAAGLSLLMDGDLRKRRKKRSRELVRSYPEFVSRLQLYISAGLTVRNAFLRIGKEYLSEKEVTGKKRYLYEEVLICSYGLLNGKPEAESYLEWGKRCKDMKYRKLSFLLNTHLRKGNEKILSFLAEETDLALEERSRLARKRGEEAGTKLLFPMMLMLVVVMFLILLPAFSGFGAK